MHSTQAVLNISEDCQNHQCNKIQHHIHLLASHLHYQSNNNLGYMEYSLMLISFQENY